MELDGEGILSALAALAEQLDYTRDPNVELVICGGSALGILGLIERPTRDVDVLALADTLPTGVVRLLPIEFLPDHILQAAAIVARDLDLPPDWLNAKAAQAGQSLPDGLIERSHVRRFGDRLVIYIIDRVDQICLKLHAVVDRDAESRHLADLRTLKPSGEEMLLAARWCLKQDAGSDFPNVLRSCLRKIGYLNVAESVENGIP